MTSTYTGHRDGTCRCEEITCHVGHIGAEQGHCACGEVQRDYTVTCQCGEWTGEECAWSGLLSETVGVEYMPEYLRASHRAVGNSGRYPQNGATRIYVHPDCLALLIESEGSEWVSVVD